MDDKMQLKITGKNRDGEYWLHVVGGGQNAGFNLGDPSTMVGAALLKAASGQRFISVSAPADPVRDALPATIIVRMAQTKDGHIAIRNTYLDDEDLGACLIPIEHIDALIAAIALAKGEKP